MTKTTKVTLARNRIQFEDVGLTEAAEGGNGQDCTRHAAALWDEAATRFLMDAGVEPGVQVRLGHDHHAFRIYVESLDQDENGDAIDLTDDERSVLIRLGEYADEAGWLAVQEWVDDENAAADAAS